MENSRKLTDLVSVGPATADDFDRLGILAVEDLVGLDAPTLFDQLQEIKGARIDRCCEDVFQAAIAQAENPDLPKEQCQWHYWSKMRKAKQ